jgi:hypothetical protein
MLSKGIALSEGFFKIYFVCVQLSPWQWWRRRRWRREKELERPKRAGGDPRKEAEREGEDSH